MALYVSVVGSGEAKAALERWASDIAPRLRVTITSLLIQLQRHVVQDKLHGQVLHQRTGRLARSIHYQITESSGGSVVGQVGTDVEYARIHEYGGTIPAHIVEARNASMLRFQPKGSADFIFRRRVQLPDIKMPERSFLRSALTDMAPMIREKIAEAVRKGP